MIELSSCQVLLETRYLEQIKKILKNEIPNREVWMFGSRVTGTSYEASDVDLVFHPDPNAKNTHTDLNIQIHLKTIFQESQIPLFVDILAWDVIPEKFKKNILDQGYVVVQKPS